MLLMLLLLPTGLFGQAYLVGFGYGLYPGKNANINYVIDRYNETRSYLDNEMEPMKTTRGLMLHGSYMYQNIAFNSTIAGRKAFSSAWGTDQSGKLVQRDLRLKTITWGFDMMVGYFPLYLGAGLAGGITTIASKVGEKSKINSLRFQRINLDPCVELPFFLTYIHSFDKEDESTLGLQFKGGVRFAVGRSDVYEMNKEINRNTYKSDPEHKLLSRNTVYEISMVLGFFGKE